MRELSFGRHSCCKGYWCLTFDVVPPRDRYQQSCSTRHRARAGQPNITSSTDHRFIGTRDSLTNRPIVLKIDKFIARPIGSWPFFRNSPAFACISRPNFYSRMPTTTSGDAGMNSELSHVLPSDISFSIQMTVLEFIVEQGKELYTHHNDQFWWRKYDDLRRNQPT